MLLWVAGPTFFAVDIVERGGSDGGWMDDT